MIKRNRLWDDVLIRLSALFVIKKERKDFKLPFYSCTKDGLIMNAAKEVRLEVVSPVNFAHLLDYFNIKM